MMMLHAARMIDPATRIDDIKDILISDGKILMFDDDLTDDATFIARAKGEMLSVIDCTGLIAAPGLVDTHTHLRDPGYTYKEDIISGANAAKAGGYTSIICMANTNPAIDNEETLFEVLKKGRSTGINIYACATVTKNRAGEEVVDMKALREAGAVGFTDDGNAITNESIVKEAMNEARKIKMPIAMHEEEPRYIKEAGINKGLVASKMGYTGADREAEISLVQRDIKVAGESGAVVCIQHVSCRESIDLIRKAKKHGVRIFAEATPHHFSLTEEAVELYGTRAKVNPPLRTEEDRIAIIEGLKDNTIDIIATDHAPHSKEEKDKSFTEAPSGMIGLESALSLGIMNLVKPGHLSMGQLIAKMTYEPARLYKLDAGIIKEDASADIVLFDPDREWSYDEPVSKARNTPFLHKKLTGCVMLTMSAGKIVYSKLELPERLR